MTDTKRENHSYAIVYKHNSEIFKDFIPISDVRKLARYLNGFVRRNKGAQVLTVYVSDKDGGITKVVKFLKEEYSTQTWLTGWKERLLANAVSQGYALKWNSSLPKSK